MRAERALATGLVDRLVGTGELLAAARQVLLARPSPRAAPLLDRLLNLPGVRALLRPSLEARVGRQARRDHYPAPYAIIELWVRYGARGRAAYDAEAHSIARLFTTEAARAAWCACSCCRTGSRRSAASPRARSSACTWSAPA